MQSLGNSILKQPARVLQEQARLFGISFLAHTPYIVIVVVYAAAFAIASFAAGLPGSDMTLNAFIATLSVELPIIAVTVLVIEFYRMVVHEKPDEPDPRACRAGSRISSSRTGAGQWACHCSSSCSPSSRSSPM